MPTENDIAWGRYLEVKEIRFDQPAYLIDAKELGAIAQREPRLLAKFDTPAQLAKPLRDAGYTLIPVQNGHYQLVKGNLFVQVPICSDLADFTPITHFPLKTAGRGRSESQYIDQAFNSGLLSQFLKIPEMYLTIRGREYTKSFTFQFSGTIFDVSSVQIEVDAGYEGMHDLVLIEAKLGVPEHFNIRQMYYPYRHFSALVPQKRVRNLFLAYDIPSTSYHLYEYVFDDLLSPLSIQLRRCLVYKIAQTTPLTIHDLIDVHFQTYNQIVPQADDFNKVFELLSLVDAGFNKANDIADYFVFDRRQSSYYREAAEYLGLITTSRESGYALTELGITVLSEPPQLQAHNLAKVLVNSWIFTELIRRASRDGKFTNSDIDAVIAGAKNEDGTPNYGGTTIARRRRTIVAWIKWLAHEIGCFTIMGEQYILK